jgi:Ca2+-binding EF-hand superfamily protein
VSFLEAFLSLTVFAKGEFDMKLRGIFLAFDTDESGFIDRKELKTLLINGVHGLCKMVGMPVPFREAIAQFAYSNFRIIDADNSDSIEFNEFSDWVRQSEELQDFLLKYTGQQTFDRAKKRYIKLCNFFKEVFERNAIDFLGDRYVTMQELKKELKGALKDIAPPLRERLFVILDYDDKGAVSEAEYFNVMRPWASFSATDINNDN